MKSRPLPNLEDLKVSQRSLLHHSKMLSGIIGQRNIYIAYICILYTVSTNFYEPKSAIRSQVIKKKLGVLHLSRQGIFVRYAKSTLVARSTCPGRLSGSTVACPLTLEEKTRDKKGPSEGSHIGADLHGTSSQRRDRFRGPRPVAAPGRPAYGLACAGNFDREGGILGAEWGGMRSTEKR